MTEESAAPSQDTAPTSEATPETPPVAPEAAPEAAPETPPQEATPPPESAAEPETPPERADASADVYVAPDGSPKGFDDFAKSLNLTQAQGEGVLKAQGMMKQAELQNMRQVGEAHVKTWGDKAGYNMNLARRAMKQMDPDGGLRKLLDTTGFGNHPEVLNFFLRQGTSLSEGGFLKGNVNRPPGKKTVAQKMFPNMTSSEL